MARPESFSISARRRISAHSATFMASSFPGWNAATRRPGARYRPVASALRRARHRRRWPGGGRESTWVKRASWAIRSRSSNSLRAWIKAGSVIRSRVASVPSP